ncbi:serine/threonine-protein kinase [Streptomonospora alba]|uniref:serine/threonine-protein kinase n=1 Tax=Streptomonospora alba TaxID=183763 RepID=UPI00069C1BD4|nr:serine/threonine-protein kinase [Streptomonospora alba]
MSEGGTGGGEHYAGSYRLAESLGRGGFGEVFRAEAPDGRTAAVKLLHATWAGDAGMRRRFADEVEQARRVSGFCVAPILDADPDARQPWIATEYIDGPTLEAAVRDHGPRRGADLHRLAVATATALAAIHGAGVVHRDLKPANILLAPDGPRVIDFGIARAIEATSMTASGVVGTIGYMAPEQLEGARLTAAVDVFSWGAVIVYAATGVEAFAAPTQAARTVRVLTGDPDTGDLDDPLLPIVLACLDKDPAARPSARTLLDMLLGTHVPDAAGERSGESGKRGGLREAVDEGPTPVEAEARTRVEGVRGGGTRVETVRTEPGGGSEAGRDRPATLRYTGYAPGGTRAAPGDGAQAPAAPPQAWPPGPAPASPVPAPESRRADTSAQPPDPAGGTVDLGRAPAGGVPPYWFAGHRCTDPGELAAAMQADWTAAVGVFSDEEERAALGAWMVDDVGDTATDRSIFRRRPDDANRAVAWFVAQQRPDLPPVFRGRPAAAADLRVRFAQVRPVFTGAPPDNELLLLARPEVLRLLALHADPGSGELRALADDLATAEQAATRFRTRMEQAVPRLAQHAAVDSVLILALLLAPERPVRPDAGGHAEVGEWYDVLWGAVAREQDPAARAGTAATVASLTGAARDSGMRRAEWAAALAEAERGRAAASARWERESRLSRARLWVRRSPLLLIAPVAVLIAVQMQVFATPLQPVDVAGWGVLFLGAWLLSAVVSWVIGRFSGPTGGFPSAEHAAHANLTWHSDYVARLADAVEQMRAELHAVRRACDP